MAPESRFLCLLLALQAAAKLPCSEQGIFYKDPEVLGAAPNGAWVLDAPQCRSSCVASPTCVFFSFVPSNLPGAGECWLLGQKAKAEKREGVISGRKVCSKEIDEVIHKCHSKHECPSHWSSGLGGFLCLKGDALGACRQAAHGAFPSNDCEAQCSIGIVDTKEAIAEQALQDESKKDHQQLERGFAQVHPCASDTNHKCPRAWEHEATGGYFCHSHSGCRPADHGPFPSEECEAQCSIGKVDVAGGGDVAVPFNCQNVNSKDWSDHKKRWCCANSVDGPCEEKDNSASTIGRCHTDLKTSCPHDWYQPHSGEGGFYCHESSGCRAALDGPFPLESCKEQCYIGRVAREGWIPKPVYWDCHLHLQTWHSVWSKEKQSWCCKHFEGARGVCAAIKVTHEVKVCGAYTAGGVPCNFPFHWGGQKHYSCVVEKGLMAGKPWCSRVDGRWSECDCQERQADQNPGAHLSTSVSKVTLHTGLEAVEPCQHAKSHCPKEWSTGASGGYFCHSDKGCRPADQGPFPVEDCKAQCSIGSVYVPGGGDVAVPYDCLLHVERWKSHWSNEKKRWCCEHSEEGQVACGAEESSVSSGSLRICPKHLQTSCPDAWHDPISDESGFYCHGEGATQGGCREKTHGPFPLEDCKEQCYIGNVRISGFLPKPVLWDCQRHLDHWESSWSKEKQLWCCTHDRYAREVCGHISVSHKLVTSCDAKTAGGIPCDFPFKWNGKKHYSCTIDDVQMGGQPWCSRVDGTWADCDCQGFGSHVISIDVTHVHQTFPDVSHLDEKEDMHWRPQGVVEGIDTAINCSKKEQNMTQTKKQWCCQVSPNCTVNVTEFDCLAGLAQWETDWSLEKKVWCWTSGGHHDLFDCADGVENADNGWSTDKQDWCCRNKQLGCAPYFDCDNGLETWETSWNLTKKKWCWDHEQKGYLHPYRCEGTFADQEKWPSAKQDWCCQHMHKGCMGNYDCKENYDTWQVQWTAEKKHYCCEKEGKGCYDCNAGLANWDRGWSDKKKAYCCKEEKKACYSCLDVSGMSKWSTEQKGYCCSTQNVACHNCTGDVRLFLGDKREWCCKNEGRCPPELTLSSTSSTTNCPDAIDLDDPAYCNTPIGTWPEEKREFCCKHFKRGCPDKKFDCDEDLKNHEWAWSEKKKEWCCNEEKKGCPPPINCHTSPTSWTLKKRHYCCTMHHIGCDLYHCRDGTSPHTWSAERQHWCCMHEDIGCPVEKKPLYPYDCLRDVSRWRERWHHAKKEYCCKKIDIGCEDHGPGPEGGGSLGGCSATCNWDSQSFTCAERIKYAASHRFANQQHACVAAHHLVAGECDHCGQCTVEMSGCYVFWHGETHHQITKHIETTVVHGVSQFDCNVDFTEWEIKWDARKKELCCQREKKACARYQCDLDLVNFKLHWGTPKKVWCCEHEHLGCEPGLQWFDCTEQAEHWEHVWKPEKKTWCCAHEQKGCPGWKWHPPIPVASSMPEGVVHVTHNTYTTHHVHHGGHWDVGFGNSWHHGGEWHQGHHPAVEEHTTHHTEHHEFHTEQKDLGQRFHCHAALTNWEDAWSPAKKTWCWKHYKLGYRLAYNCHIGEASSWSDAKNNWCCSQMNVCHTHQRHFRFDCNAALGNWEKTWSPSKKTWCWENEQKGGPPAAPTAAPTAAPAAPAVPAVPEVSGESAWGAGGMIPEGFGIPEGFRGDLGSRSSHHGHLFDCQAALGNWENAWSMAKKGWCWRREKKGGPEPFNCYTDVLGWTEKKKSWCCEQHRHTCPERRLSEKMTDIFT